MKTRIVAFILAISIGLVGFSASVPVVASASVGVVLDIFEVVQFLVTCMKKSIDDYNDRFSKYEVDFSNPNDTIKARAEILEKFRNFKTNLPSGLTKSDFDQFLEWWSIGDTDSISEKYGRDVGSYCNTNREYYLDFEKLYIMKFFKNRADFVNALYDSDLDNYTIDDNGNPQIPADDFKKEIEDQNQTIDPKNREFYKYSWRDLSPKEKNLNVNNFARNMFKISFLIDGTNIDFNDEGFYVQMYMFRNGKMYYLPYQYHYYYMLTDCKVYRPGDSGDNYETGRRFIWYCEPIYYETLDGSSIDRFSVSLSTLDAKYITVVDENGDKSYNMVDPTFANMGFTFGGNTPGPYFTFYDTASNSLDNVPVAGDVGIWQMGSSHLFGSDLTGTSAFYRSNYAYFLRSDDVTDKYPLLSGNIVDNSGNSVKKNGLDHFFATKNGRGNYDKEIDFHDHGDPNGKINVVTCDEDQNCDFGFLVSSEEFSTVYKIDTSRIPSNAVVTINGGDVYDYTITNPDSGDSTTIYNYITNNYDYPPKKPDLPSTNPNGNGGVGGTVNVSGGIDVSGGVDVNVSVGVDVNVSVPDIHIKVDQNGGGNTVNTSYDMPDMSPLDGYLDEAISQSSGIRQFLGTFFGFIPVELVILMGIGLTVVILARILGR